MNTFSERQSDDTTIIALPELTDDQRAYLQKLHDAATRDQKRDWSDVIITGQRRQT